MNVPAPAAPVVRSPSYPNAPLGEAVAQVAKIEKLYRQGPVDREVAAKLIGYSGLSGPASKALAALASYGLVERAGKGEMRVTSRARAILHPDNLEERRQGLVAAAFEPSLFQEIRGKWPDMIPPEEGITTYLHRQGFNQSAIRPAMKAYRDTLLFLEQEGANDSHGTEQPDAPNQSGAEGGKTAALGKAQVGDLVEVEIGGTLITPRPVRVRAVMDDAWVFVEGSETGIEMESVTVIERPTEGKSPPKLPLEEAKREQPSETPAGYRSETFNADEGDIRITWPSNLSAQSVEDMKDWLELLKRRIARRAGAGEVSESE
ncbi:hypothetical protein MZO42_05755 [Sphingomonas psychrotolerans]|uniref:Uncharacterized protein n=1 Tax=Sphingomonas psychrotolerans TaxID=1327635 RepID=A0ABU3N4F4_9SPHN|nr:hypothetical protein [Sphingomonas psychrotolerans]MDT8758195.1 hypothetical protein [Sphingomonas psychrotolerans]